MKKRSLRRGNWSVTELDRLRDLLPRRGVADAARLLRRSPDSVARKALQLWKQPARRGAWSVDDDARLRQAWGAVEPRLLGALLGRSSAEVNKRAAELRRNLRSGGWARAELQLLKEVYGTRADVDLEVVLGRPGDEIAVQAAALCLAKDKRFLARQAAARGRLVTTPAAGHRRIGGPAAGRGPAAAGTPRAMPRWTAEEVDRLRGLYPEHDNLAVARVLGRTVTGVANKANQLGLKKSPELLATIGRQNVGIRHRPGHDVPAESLVVRAQEAEAGHAVSFRAAEPTLGGLAAGRNAN